MPCMDQVAAFQLLMTADALRRKALEVVAALACVC